MRAGVRSLELLGVRKILDADERIKWRYPDIGLIARTEKDAFYDVSGVEDHLRMFLRWRPTQRI